MNFIDILSSYHIMPQFPPGAVRQAETVPAEVSAADLKGRRDLTDKLIITIDGDDAKDFDDAVSVEILENGNYCLGVHIADVTHYVKEGSPIDRAAFSRGTSVYLIDTVIPMLPFELSNELCSLKPDVVRLTVSVFMEVNRRGEIKSYEICNSFIKSSSRMTYANVTEILEGNIKLREKFSQLVPMLEKMNDLAKILKKKRISEGSIEFETHESKITLDSKGRPVKIEKYPITISNGIIEEFMLICNVTVAKYLVNKGLPCVFRIHEKPDLMRLERLGEVLPVMGVDYPIGVNMKPSDFQRILKSVENSEKAEVVSYLLLRAMAKARYSEINHGHFGLGFGTYCHFTSPIRRYSDIVVHRILKESLEGEISEKRKAHLKEITVAASVTASVTEVNAADAELKWKSVKKAEYMADKIGEKYEGIITHILSSGFFVELPNTVEGFVAARTLEDDIYILADSGVAMIGMKNKRAFYVGDKVRIKVAAVDAERCFVDFEVEGSTKLAPMRRKSSRRKGSKTAVDKDNKRILREMMAVQKEEKAEKNDLRQKAETEKSIFENAVVAILFEMLSEINRFSKPEKGFVGVTLSDFAAMISMPVYKAVFSEKSEVSLKNTLISASANTKNTLRMIADSFGFEIDEKHHRQAVDFVCASLRHLEASLRYDNLNYRKRENEYYSIAKKSERRGERV